MKCVAPSRLLIRIFLGKLFHAPALLNHDIYIKSLSGLALFGLGYISVHRQLSCRGVVFKAPREV